jgi:hypothetical protein
MAFKSSLLSKATNSQSIANSMNSTNPEHGISLMMLEPDTEPIIQIESDLRHITIPKELYNIAVTGDHLSETIYFQIPRYFDGEDLSGHDCLIRYINAGKEYGESDVCDVDVANEYIKFGWKIDNCATRYSGVLKFTVQFETIQNGVEYQWQTTPAELFILAGLDIEKTLSEKDDVLFRTLTTQIQDIQKILSSIQIETDKISSLESQIEKLTNDVEYLKENVVYTLTE